MASFSWLGLVIVAPLGAAYSSTFMFCSWPLTLRASLGARLRALEDFDNVCVSLAMDCFDGYCTFDSYALLEEITAEDCRLFVAEALAPERLALSVITPKEREAKA